MPMPYNNLTISGSDGRRVPVTECKIEPLNLLIPGNAPILVPKRTAWRPPRVDNSSRRDSHARHRKGKQQLSLDYEAEDEEDDEDVVLAAKQRANRSNSRSKGRLEFKETCRKESLAKGKVREAEHRRYADVLLGQSERAREKAEAHRQHSERRKHEQEKYIARLRAKYEGSVKYEKNQRGRHGNKTKSKHASKKMNAVDETNNSSTSASETSGSEDQSTSDDNAYVRKMLENMKIRAAGTNSLGARDNGPFTASEDAQLLVYKNNNESWKFISETMGRGKSELQKRFKELKASNAKIPGENIDVEGSESKGDDISSDAATAGDTTTADEKTDDEKKDEGGDDSLLSGLMGALEAVADEGSAKKVNTSPEKRKGSPAKSDNGHKKDNKKKNQPKDKNSPSTIPKAVSENNTKKQKSCTVPPSTNDPGGARGQDADSSVPEDSLGIKAYIGQYAKQLLEDANAGLARIPQADDNFDEDDCILLALADSYRRSNRWLDIQSDFANVTGRLVPEEVLRWKLGEGEEPRGS